MSRPVNEREAPQARFRTRKSGHLRDAPTAILRVVELTECHHRRAEERHPSHPASPQRPAGCGVGYNDRVGERLGRKGHTVEVQQPHHLRG
jgi:hypothetical protein